jgi:type IV pilus assembly protein PilE
MNKQRGFTLIEIMIALAICAILAAVAMPVYTDYIIRGQLTAARAELDAERIRMEQFFMDNRTYDGGCPAISKKTKYWEIECVDDATTYLLTAKPIEGVGPADFEFTINQAQQRDTADAPMGWDHGHGCWVVRKGTGAGAC